MLERGEGPYVFDTHGSRYFDALSSLFCAQIGYSYGEEMAAAIAAPARRRSRSTRTGAPRTRRRSSSPSGSPSSRRATSTARSSPPAARSRSRPRGSSCAQYHLGDRRAPAHARRSPATSPTTASPSGRCRSPAWRDSRRPFGPPAIDVTHVVEHQRFRAPDGDDPAAL